MAKIGMNENKAHVDEIHNIRSGSSVYVSVRQGSIYCKKSETMPNPKFKMEKLCQS